MAPRLPLLTNNTPPRPPRLANRYPPHGQAQTNMGSFNRLWRLRSRYRLQRRLRHGKENGAEEILSAYYEAGQLEDYQYGEYGAEMGWGRGSQEGG